MFGWLSSKTSMVDPAQALPGRSTPVAIPARHAVLGTPLQGPWPDSLETIVLALGCFWGAEKDLWNLAGVYTTAVGYSGGYTPNPSYEEVCSGRTGHAEAVLVVFDPAALPLGELLRTFWEHHDPTQSMRQGNDVGTQYRSAIFVADDTQRTVAESSRAAYGEKLSAAGYGPIATQVEPVGPFFYAEDYHQQYLYKVPNGYCPANGTGVSCPVGLGLSASAGQGPQPAS